MPLPPFPIDAIRNMPDDELGKLLLGWFFAAQADELGIPVDQISLEFAKRVRQYVLTLETTTAKNAAVEKALHKAARGDFSTAGKLLREHMITGAVALKFIPIGIKKARQVAEFRRLGAQRSNKGEAKRQVVLDAAAEILAGRARQPSQRELARLIAEKTKIPIDTARRHLRKTENKK